MNFSGHNIKEVLTIIFKFQIGGDVGTMKNKPKPDDRRDNVEKIQYNIGKTIQNIELAEEMIAKTDDEKMKKTLMEKNERRREALKGMREEIRDEALDKRKGYN